MERIPILKMGEYLLITIQVDMHDKLAMTLQNDLTEQIVQYKSKGILIDISALEIVDSFIGRMLGIIASMSRLLDAETVVVGMQPSVAITLVELGLSLPGIRTSLNVDRGMELLRAAREALPFMLSVRVSVKPPQAWALTPNRTPLVPCSFASRRPSGMSFRITS